MAMPGPHTDTLCRSTEISRKRAAIGSEQLRKAMRREFGKLAMRHGVSLHDALLLCMNAEGPAA